MLSSEDTLSVCATQATQAPSSSFTTMRTLLNCAPQSILYFGLRTPLASWRAAGGVAAARPQREVAAAAPLGTDGCCAAEQLPREASREEVPADVTAMVCAAAGNILAELFCFEPVKVGRGLCDGHDPSPVMIR